MDTNELKENKAENGKKPFKRPMNRFEFALFINDFLICKRNVQIENYIEKSMQTPEFKAEVDKIVDLIDSDLKSKTRIYTYYHYPEIKFVGESYIAPEWEPEIMIDPLIEEGSSVLKFVIYDNGKEVISRSWDARNYPTYVRKNIDLTNNQVKITRGESVNIYNKETFFADHGNQLYGDLYVLKHMISDKEDLIPVIQNLMNEICSSLGGYYEKIGDYRVTEEYRNCDIKRDANGNGIYRQKTQVDAEGNEYPVVDAFGNPWMEPVFDKAKEGKKYCFNINSYNKKVDSKWGTAVAEKTRKYMNELYVAPRERRYKKKEN